MAEAKVHIVGKDKKVGAMVKALAREIAGFQPVRGATKEFLAAYGYYLFDFPNTRRAAEFREAVRKYLPVSLAMIQE
jgi:NDP-sugar pyrophosphorylase family protein